MPMKKFIIRIHLNKLTMPFFLRNQLLIRIQT